MYIKFKKTRKISNQFFDVMYNSISVKKMRQNKKVERIAATTTENRNERLRLCFYDNHPIVLAWLQHGIEMGVGELGKKSFNATTSPKKYLVVLF